MSPYVIIYSSLLFGAGSLLVFGAFLFFGPFGIVDLKLGTGGALFFDAVLSLVFFVQHSMMIRRWCRRWVSARIPGEHYDALYSIASGVVLLFVVILWQEVRPAIAEAEGMARWTLRLLFFLSIAGFHWGVRSLSAFDPFGVRKIMIHLRRKKPKSLPLAVRGAYRWVRHPLYLFMLVMIWSFPYITADRLLFNILWTTWTVVATFLEERDLVADFGDAYREYQAKVPMLVPWKVPRDS